MQPQDVAKSSNPLDLFKQQLESGEYKKSQLNMNMSRGVKTPQTIKESNNAMNNQTTPRAHTISNKNFRS